MITTLKMELVSFVVLRERAELVLSALLKAQSFHPVDIKNVESLAEGVSRVHNDAEYAKWDALELRLRDMSRKLKYAPAIDYTQDAASVDWIKRFFDALDGELEPLVGKRQELQESLKTRQAIASQLAEYTSAPVHRGESNFLEMSVGSIDEKNAAVLSRSLKDMPHVLYPYRRMGTRTWALSIGLRRDKAALHAVLHDCGWQEEQPGAAEELSFEARQQLQGQIAEDVRSLKGIDERVASLAKHVQSDMARVKFSILLNKSLLRAKKYSYATEKTVLISGWVPAAETQRLMNMVRGTDASAYIEYISAEESRVKQEDIPVLLQHNAFLRPFEILIDSYGIPRYGSIDPTVFTAIGFLFMFGAMFGDFGQGLVLLAVGMLMTRSQKEKVKQAGLLVSYSGISAAVFGFLYGECFGMGFTSVWIKPMRDIMALFKVAVAFGIGVISLGIILNIINAIRDRNYVKAIFDKAGLVGGVVYWAAIGLVVNSFSAAAVHPLYLMLVAAGLVILLFEPVIELYAHAHKRQESFLMIFVESSVHLLEVVIGYVANTISFVRLAAYAITHASLFLAIFEFSRVVRSVNPQAGWLLGGIIIFFGNILIIVLEGMVASIQSLRLNYYEFYSKFFILGRNAYKPITIEE